MYSSLDTRGICILELQPDNVVAIHGRRVDFKITGLAKARRVPAAGIKVSRIDDPLVDVTGSCSLWSHQVNIDGDFEYLAPEIIKQQEVTVATDVWCVAVLTYILLSGFSPFRGNRLVPYTELYNCTNVQMLNCTHSVQETAENVSFVRYHFDHLYASVTQEAIRFLMLIFKRTPSKRPTLEECSDHKWLLPDDYMTKKRDSAVFAAQPLSDFADDHHARRAAATPQELLQL